MMFGVLKAWHPMVGVDFHIPWPPGSPVPAPARAPYFAAFIMIGTTLTSRWTPRHNTHALASSMVRGTDIGPLIIHVGVPSITLPLEILLSGSKSHFGPTSITVSDQKGGTGNPAAALGVFVNLNLNCGFPIPTPFGLVIAPTTHMVGMTLGDLIAGLLFMTWDFLIQAALNKLGAKIGDVMGNVAKRIANKLGVGVMSRAASRAAARSAWKAGGKLPGQLGVYANALRAQDANRIRIIVQVASTWGPAKVGFWTGAPLGPSVSNVPGFTSGYDVGTGAAADAGFNTDMSGVGQAIDDYFNTPAVPEVGG